MISINLIDNNLTIEITSIISMLRTAVLCQHVGGSDGHKVSQHRKERAFRHLEFPL